MNNQQLKRSFTFACKGLAYTWKHEQNFRVQSCMGFLVIFAGILLGLSALRMVVLLMLVTMVLVLELLNTFFEKLIDLLSPRVHQYAAMLKDLLAAVVFVASVGAAVIGGLIFLPSLYSLFFW